jgi:hypothetical protein
MAVMAAANLSVLYLGVAMVGFSYGYAWRMDSCCNVSSSFRRFLAAAFGH